CGMQSAASGRDGGMGSPPPATGRDSQLMTSTQVSALRRAAPAALDAPPPAAEPALHHPPARRRWWLLLLAALVVAGAVWAMKGRDQMPPAAGATAAPAVLELAAMDVMQVQPQVLSRQLPLSGSLSPLVK